MELQKVKGAKLRALRAMYGLNQEKMAKIAKVSICTYRDIELEERELRPSEAKRIKEEFNLNSVEEILYD